MKSQDDKAQRLFDAAMKAEDEGDLNKALRLYKKVAEIDGHYNNPMIRLAGVLHDLGQWKAAIQAARKVTRRRPNALVSHTAYSIIADCYREQRQFLRAERAYRQALAFEQHPWTWVLLSRVLVPLERQDEAITCLQNALKIDPNYEEAHYNLGVDYRFRGQNIRAEKHLRRAIEIDPDFSLAYAELGLTLIQHKKGVRDKTKATEAIRLLKKSIKLNPNYGWSRVYLANALWGFRKLKAADEQYRKVIELWPDFSLSYWCYGGFLAYESMNDSLAEEYLRKAIELDPKDDEANYNLGKHLHYWDRNDEAIKFLRKAAKQGHEKAAKILRTIETQSQKESANIATKKQV